MKDNQQLQVKIYRTWQDVSQLADRWNELLSQSSSASVYLTYEWLKSWWIAFGASRELFVIGFFGQDGTLIGIAPFYRIQNPDTKLPVRVLRFLGTGTGALSTSLGLIFRKDYEASGVRRLLDWLSASRSEWNVMDLHYMQSESPVTQMLAGEIARNRWFYVQNEGPHSIVSLPDNYETYLGSLSKKMRSEIPYENRRLQKHFKVDIRKVLTEDELPPAVDELMRLNTERWQARGKAGSFFNEERRVFVHEMSREFLKLGWLDFWMLDLDGRPAAIEFGFRYGETFYPQWMALDSEYQAHSPGFVLKSHIIQELIRDGIRIYDFMGGVEPYKMRWGVEKLKYKSLLCAAPYSSGALYLRMSIVKKSGIKSYVRSKCSNYLNSVLPPKAISFFKDLSHRLRLKN